MSHRETRPEYGTVALTDLPHIGSIEKFDILDHNSESFIVRHLFQHSHNPKQIRNAFLASTKIWLTRDPHSKVRRVKHTVSIHGLLHHIYRLVFL